MRNGLGCCAFYFGDYRIFVREVCYNGGMICKK